MTSRLLALGLLLLGCGARTGLVEPDAAPAPWDAATARDATVPPVAVERCNGSDDDDDGRVDEDVPAARCGVCEVAGCVDGHPGTCAPGGTGAPELCNAIDDDCDGRVDEGLPFELVGDPIVLREVDEGSVGTCGRCDRVLGATLQTMGGRLYAIWHFDYGGYVAGPTSFARPLDDRGRPIGPPRPLLDVPITRLRLAPSHDGLTIASFCERDMDVVDHWRSAFLDGDARQVGEVQARQPDDPEEECSGVPAVTWNGSTHFFVRAMSGRLRVETADASGRTLASELHETGAAPRLARWGPDVFLAAGFGRALLRFDANARRVGSVSVPHTLRDPLLMEGTSSLLLLGQSPRTVDLIEVDPEAETSSMVGSIDLGGVVRGSDVVRRAPDELVGAWTLRPEYLVHTEVVRFTSRGEELGRWILPEDDATSDYVVRVHGGRVLVIYLREVESVRNRVELLELGCVP